MIFLICHGSPENKPCELPPAGSGVTKALCSENSEGAAFALRPDFQGLLLADD